MPTVIVLDTSLSMMREGTVSDCEESRLQLAVHGINTFLEYLAIHAKLEFVALMTFSSVYEVVSQFTRDFDLLKTKLSYLEEQDTTRIEPVLHGVNGLVLSEWGSATPCHVVLVTDGDMSHGAGSWDATLPLPFPFPGKLVVTVLADPGTLSPHSAETLHQLMEAAGGGDAGGAILQPDMPLSLASVAALFTKMADDNYVSFTGMLKCGHLGSKVTLLPAPMPYMKTTDFESATYLVSSVVEVCGFVAVSHVGSPAAVSRHLVLPHGTPNMPVKATTSSAPPIINLDATDSDEDVSLDDGHGKTPSFCVLLHGALKVENMAALCQVGNGWFGILYSWADSKKKSNLMLTLLEPGANSVPWLGNFNSLGVPSDTEVPGPDECFPVRPSEKRSYSQNCVVWIRQAGLQSDIQKILRHARKLPDKTQHFYKELNRVRRAAISLGFLSLLEGLAAILERECTLLPGSAHPDCALQLTHAAGVLRKPYSRDPKFNVLPMRTKFTDGD